ncbi:MAG: LysR substrate-binding domain-containing protein [Hyphomicrobiaceae bacterium]
MPCFATIPAMVEASDLVAAIPLRVAREFARRHAIDFHALPDTIPTMTVYMVWHERFDADDGHMWLRRMLREICENL